VTKRGTATAIMQRMQHQMADGCLNNQALVMLVARFKTVALPQSGWKQNFVLQY
jgi:hypothetical protein